MPHQLPAHASDNSNPPSGPLIRNFPGPALSLSLDVLETVFMFAESDPDDDETHPLLQHVPFNVSQVSRHWRWVALGRHGLWTTMRSVIVTKSDMRHTARDLALFKTCLSRCGPVLPLTVSTVINPIEDWDLESEDVSTVSSVAAASMCRYMRLIMPVRHRLRTAQLVFRIDAPESPSPGIWPWHIDNMPELEYLEAQYPFLREDNEPGMIDLSACNERIRTCIITGCLEMCIADGLTLSNLDVLKLDVLGNGSDTVALAASWYNALRRMPRLSHLSVCMRKGLDWDHHPDTHIDLPKLRKLCVRFTAEVEDHFPGYSHAFLNNISCPNLKELKIMCNYPEKPEERLVLLNSVFTGCVYSSRKTRRCRDPTGSRHVYSNPEYNPEY